MISIIPSRHTHLAPPFKIGVPANELCCTVLFVGLLLGAIDFTTELYGGIVLEDRIQQRNQPPWLDCQYEFTTAMVGPIELGGLLKAAYSVETQLNSEAVFRTELNALIESEPLLLHNTVLQSALSGRYGIDTQLGNELQIGPVLDAVILRPACNEQE